METKAIIKELEECIEYFTRRDSEWPDLIVVISEDKYIRLSFIMKFLQRIRKNENTEHKINN